MRLEIWHKTGLLETDVFAQRFALVVVLLDWNMSALTAAEIQKLTKTSCYVNSSERPHHSPA